MLAKKLVALGLVLIFVNVVMKLIWDYPSWHTVWDHSLYEAIALLGAWTNLRGEFIFRPGAGGAKPPARKHPSGVD